jgi:hypothetical protein
MPVPLAGWVQEQAFQFKQARHGDRAKMLLQFLSEIGAKALRTHLGRVLEVAKSSADAVACEKKIVERFEANRVVFG